jgi:protein-S-isoprenylcysteine O-methyltransferase Ste14
MSHPSGAPRLPPLALAVLVFAAMWLQARLGPALPFDFPGRHVVALALVLVAGAIGLAGTGAFRRAGTTVDPLDPRRASALVTGGMFRHTRNPMYLAVALALAGWGLHLGDVPALLGVPAFVAWMDRLQIPAEERALRERFGAEFERYCRAVRRWF